MSSNIFRNQLEPQAEKVYFDLILDTEEEMYIFLHNVLKCLVSTAFETRYFISHPN